MNFVTDVNVDKMREVKKVRFLSKREDEPDPVGYGAPLIRAERPWVIFIDHRTEEEKKMDQIRQEMGQGVAIKEEQSIPEVEFQIPTIESYGSTELVDDKDAVGKYIKNIKMEDKRYLEGLSDVDSSNKRKTFDGEERKTVKRRKAASPSDDESSFGTSPSTYESERQNKGRRQDEDYGRKDRARRRSVVSPIKIQEMILSEKDKGLSKERSYLQEVERSRSRISIDSKTEDDDEDLEERDKDYQIDDEEEEEEEEEEQQQHKEVVPMKADRSKQHNTRRRMGGSPSLDKKLKQPSRGPTTQELKKRKNVEALKKLQKRDLEENRTGGTYVQCCNQMCAKWRLVAEYLESSQVGIFRFLVSLASALDCEQPLFRFPSTGCAG